MNQPWVYMCSPSWAPLPPPSASHPSGSFQCTSPEHPVLCIEPGLAIYFTYDNIHVIIFSQIIPPSPSPMESKSLFFTSVSLLLSHIEGPCYHFSKFHIYVNKLYWCFSFWVTSLCIIGSGFIHLFRTDSNAFFLIAKWYSIVYMYQNFLIHSSADGHLGYFHVLAIVNSPAMNIGVHMSLESIISSALNLLYSPTLTSINNYQKSYHT